MSDSFNQRYLMPTSRILWLLAATAAIITATHHSVAQDAPPPPPAASATATAAPTPNEPEPADAEAEAQERLAAAQQEQLERELETAERAVESLRDNEEPLLRQGLAEAARTRAEVDRQLREVRRTIKIAQAGPVAPPDVEGAPVAPAIAVNQRLHSIVGRAPARVLVIRFDKTDAAAQANIEEDMNVMSRVLERSVTQKLGEDDGPKASGIQVFFAPDGGSPRNLYLEGYGSIFVMNVRFPLLAPADKPEGEKPKQDSDSSWEDAKRDLYGERDPWNIGKALRFEFHGGEPQPYDGERVEKLRQSLVESLKSATNIRGLKPDEWIVVTVLGGPGQGPVKARAARRSNGDRPGAKRPPGSDDEMVYELRDEQVQARGPRGTIMTLRVKKSDVDEFAKGRWDLDQFRKKVSISTYPANTGGGGGLF